MEPVTGLASAHDPDMTRAEKKKKTRRQTNLAHPNLVKQYDQVIADKICELIANGMSYPRVQEICADAPTWWMITKWRAENKDFDRLYRAARIAQAEHFVDQISDIADNSRDAAMAAVRIKSRQWLAAKRLPQVYGDAVKLEIEDTTPQTMTAFEIARRLSFAMREDNSPIIDNLSHLNQPKVSPITGLVPDIDENTPENGSEVLFSYARAGDEPE